MTNGQNNLGSTALVVKLVQNAAGFANQPPTVTVTSAPTAKVKTNTATVNFTVNDINSGETALGHGSTLDAESVEAGYSVSSTLLATTPGSTGVATITAPNPSSTMRTIPERTVTLTLTPSDSHTNGTPVNVMLLSKNVPTQHRLSLFRHLYSQMT